MSERSARGLLVASLLLAVGGCASVAWLLNPPPRLPPCPGPIPSTAALPAGDRGWRDRVRYRGVEVDVGFALVAEKRADRLVLVALNNFGARVFSLTQQEGQLVADSRLGRALQVAPETVLRDWYAARAARLEAPGRLELARPECGYTAVFVPEATR